MKTIEIFDTAPVCDTLLHLDATLSYHRSFEWMFGM